MKLIILTSLVASASAFAPAANSVRTSALGAKAAQVKSDFAGEIGAQMPLGYFDPLGMCQNGEKELFDEMRFVELKHGRVAMLAVVGYLVTKAGVRFPGLEEIPSGFAAFGALRATEDGCNVLLQMVFAQALMEIVNSDITGENEFPGDFRNGALDFGWDKQSDDWKRKKRSIELNNGRAAQMGIFGLMIHEAMGNLDTILPLAAGAK
jgi:hypothetical protein